MKENPTKTVCFFNSNKAWGGGEKWHFTAAKELTRRGYTTFLCTNRNSELTKKAIQERVDVYQWIVGNLSFLNPLKIFVLAAFFKAKKVDVVILNLPSDLKFAGIAAKVAGVKKIIYRRGMPHPLRNTWLNRFLFQKVLTDVIVNSKEVGRALKQGNDGWFPDKKMRLVYNGIDRIGILSNKKIYDKKENEFVIGNIGRLTEQKGQKYLIEIAQNLKRENSKFIILIAGEGELQKSLQQKINEADLQDQIKLLGHVDNVPDFLNSIDIFAFTSIFEGFANTLIEVLAAGVPTVAWDISSNSEIIKNGETGILINPFDVAMFSQNLKEIIINQELKMAITYNGQRLIEREFLSKHSFDLVEMLVKE